MKKVFLPSVMFFVGFLVISFLFLQINFFIMKSIRIGDIGLLNNIAAGHIDAEILVCGSSIGQSHYDPAILTSLTGLSCYNIGLSGTALATQLAVLKWYLDNNKPPKVLIQNIDLFHGDIEKNIYRPYKYLPYLSNEKLLEGLSKIDEKLWIKKYLPFSFLIYFNKDYQKSIISHCLHQAFSRPDFLNRGYLQNSRPWMGDKALKDFIQENIKGILYIINDSNLLLLNDLIKLCKTYDIQLIISFSPVKKELMEIERNRDEITIYYEQLCADNLVTFEDLSKSELSHRHEVWVNLTHMNSNGAKELSKSMGQKIKGHFR